MQPVQLCGVPFERALQRVTAALVSLKCPIALFWKCVFSVNLDEPVCLCLFFFHFEGTTRSGCANQTCCNFVFCSQITTFVVLFVCVAKPPSARSDQSPVMPLESRLAALWVSNTQANVIADYLIKNILLLRNFKPFFFFQKLYSEYKSGSFLQFSSIIWLEAAKSYSELSLFVVGVLQFI